MPCPLPRPNPYDTSKQLIINTAYGICLDLEDRHNQVLKTTNLDVLVCSRFLGFMIVEAPTEEGRTEFATEVIRCQGDDDLQKLGELYKDHFLRVCKSVSDNE
jgi:hypothetical protein